MAKNVRVRAELEGAEDLLKKLTAMQVDVKATVKTAAVAGGQVIAAAANANLAGAGVDVSTARVRAAGAVEVDVGPKRENWYLRFLETGAKPHMIRAAKGKFLQFKGEGGKMRRVRMVSHPGMAARPFLRPAFDGGQDGATQAVGAVLRKAIDGNAG